MRKVSNRKFALNVAIISIISLAVVYIFIKLELSKSDMALFIARFNSMLFAGFMILVLIIFIIIFLARLVFKKKIVSAGL